MKKRLFFFTFILLLVSGPAFAQGLSGETEVGTDGKGGSFFSQYLFYDFNRVNVLTRYFWVNGVLERGEFAVGPTMKLGDSVLKLQFGGTTDKDVMLAGTLSTKILGHDVFYIADGTLSTTEAPNTLYQKAFIALTKGGSWQFRVEDLQVGKKQEFLRIGLEYQRKLPHNSHLFIAPFYDPIKNGVGGQVGFRFF